MCDMLKLRTFIDLGRSPPPIPPPPPPTNRPSTRSNVRLLLSSGALLSCPRRRALLRVRTPLVWWSLSLSPPPPVYCVGEGDATCVVHELGSRCNWWDRPFLPPPPPSLHPDQQQLMKVDWFSSTFCIQGVIWGIPSTRKTKDPTEFYYICCFIHLIGRLLSTKHSPEVWNCKTPTKIHNLRGS